MILLLLGALIVSTGFADDIDLGRWGLSTLKDIQKEDYMIVCDDTQEAPGMETCVVFSKPGEYPWVLASGTATRSKKNRNTEDHQFGTVVYMSSDRMFVCEFRSNMIKECVDLIQNDQGEWEEQPLGVLFERDSYQLDQGNFWSGIRE